MTLSEYLPEDVGCTVATAADAKDGATDVETSKKKNGK